MAKKALQITSSPEVLTEGPFVRLFQSQLILLLKTRGLLTESQTAQAIRLIEKEKA